MSHHIKQDHTRTYYMAGLCIGVQNCGKIGLGLVSGSVCNVSSWILIVHLEIAVEIITEGFEHSKHTYTKLI